MKHGAVKQIYAFLVQFSQYVYMVGVNWAEARRAGSGNDFTPTAVSRLESTLKLRYYTQMACWGSCNFLPDSSLDYVKTILLLQFDGKQSWLLHSCLMEWILRFLWPPMGTKLPKCSVCDLLAEITDTVLFSFKLIRPTRDLSWLVLLYTGHVDKSSFPRQAQVASVRYQYHASGSCFPSVSASAHTCLRELPEKSHSSLCFSSSHDQKTKEKWAAAKAWKFLGTIT